MVTVLPLLTSVKTHRALFTGWPFQHTYSCIASNDIGFSQHAFWVVAGSQDSFVAWSGWRSISFPVSIYIHRKSTERAEASVDSTILFIAHCSSTTSRDRRSGLALSSRWLIFSLSDITLKAALFFQTGCRSCWWCAKNLGWLNIKSIWEFVDMKVVCLTKPQLILRALDFIHAHVMWRKCMQPVSTESNLQRNVFVTKSSNLKSIFYIFQGCQPYLTLFIMNGTGLGGSSCDLSMECRLYWWYHTAEWALLLYCKKDCTVCKVKWVSSKTLLTLNVSSLFDLPLAVQWLPRDSEGLSRLKMN